jgi:hypothetical protein
MFKTASNFSQHRARIAPRIKRPKPKLPGKLRTSAGQVDYVQSLANLIAEKRWHGKNAYALASALNSWGRKTPFGERWTIRSARPLQKAIGELPLK